MSTKVIHLFDRHRDVETQKNIASAIRILAKDLDAVLCENIFVAPEPINPALFTHTTYLSWLHNIDVLIYGAESESAHRAHMEILGVMVGIRDGKRSVDDYPSILYDEKEAQYARSKHMMGYAEQLHREKGYAHFCLITGSEHSSEIRELCVQNGWEYQSLDTVVGGPSKSDEILGSLFP